MAISDDKLQEYYNKNDKIIDTLKEQLRERTAKKRDEIESNPILFEDFSWLYFVSTNDETYSDFERPIRDILDDIKKIEEDLDKAERNLRYKAHFNEKSKIGVFEVRTYQKEFEDALKEYNELCQLYYGGGYKGIIINLCEKYREEQHWGLITHYYPDIAYNRAVVYQLGKKLGYSVNQREEIKYALLENEVRWLAKNKKKYEKSNFNSDLQYKFATSNSERKPVIKFKIDYWMYEIIYRHGEFDNDEEDLNDIHGNINLLYCAARSMTGYRDSKYYVRYRLYDLDYLLWVYPSTTNDIIYNYDIHVSFDDLWNEKDVNPDIMNYVFETRVRDKVLATKKDQKLYPPFMLESCITKCIELKKKLKEFESSHDLTKRKDAIQYYQLKWEYLAMKRVWTIEAYRVARMAYEIDIDNLHTYLRPSSEDIPVGPEKTNGPQYFMEPVLQKCIHREYNYVRWEEKSTEYNSYIICEKDRMTDANHDYNKEEVCYNFRTRKGIQKDWETHLGIYKDDPEWNIIKFTEKDQYNMDSCLLEPDYQRAMNNEIQILKEIADTQIQLSKSNITRKTKLISDGFPYIDYISLEEFNKYSQIDKSYIEETLKVPDEYYKFNSIEKVSDLAIPYIAKYKDLLLSGIKEKDLRNIKGVKDNYISSERKSIYKYDTLYLKNCIYIENEYTYEIKKIIQDLVNAGVSEEDIKEYINMLEKENDFQDKNEINNDDEYTY